MNKVNLRHFFSNSDVQVILLLIFFTLITNVAAKWYRTAAIPKAPEISGYDWAKHRDVLLIIYPLADYCSTCNLTVSGWTTLGLEHHYDVLVIAAVNTLELTALRKEQPQDHLTIITGIDRGTIKRFSRGDKIGAAHIHYGYIITGQIGGSPPEDFFT